MNKETDQLELIRMTEPAVGTRHAQMLEVAINAARESGILEDIDEGLISIARANARALDNAEALGKKGGYLVSNLTGPYREVLQALRMTPENRRTEANDEFSQALAALSSPTVRNA